MLLLLIFNVVDDLLNIFIQLKVFTFELLYFLYQSMNSSLRLLMFPAVGTVLGSLPGQKVLQRSNLVLILLGKLCPVVLHLSLVEVSEFRQCLLHSTVILCLKFVNLGRHIHLLLVLDLVHCHLHLLDLLLQLRGEILALGLQVLSLLLGVLVLTGYLIQSLLQLPVLGEHLLQLLLGLLMTGVAAVNPVL